MGEFWKKHRDKILTLAGLTTAAAGTAAAYKLGQRQISDPSSSNWTRPDPDWFLQPHVIESLGRVQNSKRTGMVG
jgi:hypothetical protein